MNNEVIIKSFLNKIQASRMLEFYRTLRKEKENGTWDILILVTRKGFWIYKIVNDCFQIGTNIEEEYEYTDRYLMKSLNADFVKGKRVCLVDDTLSKGHGLFHHYCVMKCLGAQEVYPYIYAISIEFPSKRTKDEEEMQKIATKVYQSMGKPLSDTEAIMLYQEFREHIRGFRYMTQDDISRFCLNETELFQRVLCPMVINLPIFVSRPEGKVMSDELIMDQSLYEKLTGGNETWQYIRNVYLGADQEQKFADDVKGRLNCDIICDYLRYSDSLVEQLKAFFLQNMVVKCKYNIDQEGQYHISFTPFAIVRSMEKGELKRVFEILFEEKSQYRKKLIERLNDKEQNTFAWTAMFRAVIYVLSRYVGEKFKEYLLSIGVESVAYDQEIVRYNSDPEFIQEVNEMDVIARCRMLSECAFTNSSKIQLTQELESVTMQSVYESVHRMILEKESDRWDDCLKIEDLEKRLSSQFTFHSLEELEQYVTGIILLMLEISVFGNYLKVEGEKVIRGFRHGENSKLLLPETGVLCYIFSEVLYMMVSRKNYLARLNDFLEEAKCYLEDTGVLSTERDRENFKFYSEYFVAHKEEAEFHILGKEFIFDGLTKMEEDIQDDAIWLVEKYQSMEEEDTDGDGCEV